MQRPRRESVLATVLFTDIVGSSELAAELGDRRWKVLLSLHHATVRRELRRFDGRELDTAGDGFFASFANPGNAVRCAGSIVGAVQDLGIDVRTGLHLGQAEIVGRKLGGAAVHIGARTMAQAGPAEVLVTGGLKDVLPPSDFTFQDRGMHTLKGVPGEWHLYRLASLDRPLPGPLDPEVAASRRAVVQAPPMWRRRYVPVAAVATAAVIAAVTIVAILDRPGSPALAPSKSAPPGLPPHALLLLDPRTGKVRSILAIGDPEPLPPPAAGSGRWAGPGQRALAAGEGSIWVTNGGSDTVLRIDPVDVMAVSIHVSGRPDAVTVGHAGVWVASTDGELTRIDPGTNQATTTDVSEEAPIPMGIAVDDRGAVYINAILCQVNCAPPEGKLARFEPSSGLVTLVSLPKFYLGTSVIVSDGSVWMTVVSGVWKVDPMTGKVLKRVKIEEGLGDLVADPSGTSVWVATVSSGGRVGRAIQIDAATGKVIGGQPIGCCPGSIAIGFGFVWVTNAVDGTVQRISTVTGQVDSPFTVGKGVDGIAVGEGGVWVTVDH
jgi:class 3 adenylate cyclase/DNA-binding beta-propeller fold protein YncE